MKKMIKVIDTLFILLVIFSVLSYGIQAIGLIAKRQYILWTMSNLKSTTNGIEKIALYSKDIIAVVLFLLLFIMFKRTRKVALAFFCIILYGTVILFCNMNFEIRYIIAGTRMFLFFFVTIMYFNNPYLNKDIFRKLFVILKVLIVIEFFLTFTQILISGQIKNFGSGVYRFCGSFGNSGGLGNFTLAANLYLMIYNYVTKKKNNIYIFLAMNLLLSIASGSRLTMIMNFVIIFLYWNNFSFSKLKMPKGFRTIIVLFLFTYFFPRIYSFSVSRVGRGKIMKSGNTRIEILLNFFKFNNITEFLSFIIGNGIGFATNNAYNLGVDSAIIVDGTISTLIAQFGLFGIIFFLFVLIYIFIKLWKYSKKCLSIFAPYFFTIILVIAGGNIFEQISMIIIITSIFFMMKDYYIEGNVNKKSNNIY